MPVAILSAERVLPDPAAPQMPMRAFLTMRWAFWKPEGWVDDDVVFMVNLVWLRCEQ